MKKTDSMPLYATFGNVITRWRIVGFTTYIKFRSLQVWCNEVINLKTMESEVPNFKHFEKLQIKIGKINQLHLPILFLHEYWAWRLWPSTIYIKKDFENNINTVVILFFDMRISSSNHGNFKLWNFSDHILNCHEHCQCFLQYLSSLPITMTTKTI